jgi:hypothetical protein
MMTEPTHRNDEVDIGSGEKSPGQKETEKMISQVSDQSAHPPLKDKGLARDTGPAQPGNQ